MKWFLGVISAVLISTFAFAASSDKLSSGQVEQVKTVVHDYLLNNPNILNEMAQKLRQKQQQKAKAQASSAIVSRADDIFFSKTSPVLGNPNGKITIVEFLDYQCPHCRDSVGVVKKITEENKNVRVVVKEMPIFGQTSEDAATAGLEAFAQGKYQAFHEGIVKAKTPLTRPEILRVAKEAGLNVAKVKEAMSKNAHHAEIRKNYDLAKALGLVGTPTFIVGTDGNNAEYIPEAVTYERLKKAVNDTAK